MDEGKHEGRNPMHAIQCMPRLRRKITAISRPPLATSSLLQRFRKAVFKIILLSAFSKSSRTSNRRPPLSCTHGSGGGDAARHADSYRREAVEDCIEFFKRSSAAEAPAKGSSVTEEA